MISLCDGERVASPTDTERASELCRFPATYAEFTTQDSARLFSETERWESQRDWELSHCRIQLTTWDSSYTTPTHKLLWAVEDATVLSIFSANDYIIRGTEIYSGYRYSEIFWDILRYLIDIPVATAIASRGVLGTSMTLPARNIKNPGPGMPASIVLYLLPCKCRTEL